MNQRTSQDTLSLSRDPKAVLNALRLIDDKRVRLHVNQIVYLRWRGSDDDRKVIGKGLVFGEYGLCAVPEATGDQIHDAMILIGLPSIAPECKSVIDTAGRQVGRHNRTLDDYDVTTGERAKRYRLMRRQLPRTNQEYAVSMAASNPV